MIFQGIFFEHLQNTNYDEIFITHLDSVITNTLPILMQSLRSYSQKEGNGKRVNRHKSKNPKSELLQNAKFF
jgi:hypothetical protein